MRILAIINARAGTASAQDGAELREQLADLFQPRGIEADIEFVEGEDIPEAARRAVARGFYHGLLRRTPAYLKLARR